MGEFQDLTRREFLSPRVMVALGRQLLALARRTAAAFVENFRREDFSNEEEAAVPGGSADRIADRRDAERREIGRRLWEERELPPVPVLRPPRAAEERQFLELCTRCGDCISACPYGSIRHAPMRLRDAGDTPMIVPMERGCEMCEDTPCVSACETGALHPSLPVIMGKAKIVPHCLNYHGEECRLCVDKCPEEAIEFDDEHKPFVKQDLCTGCGLCQEVCPAPHNAVIIKPELNRPRLAEELIPAVDEGEG